MKASASYDVGACVNLEETGRFFEDDFKLNPSRGEIHLSQEELKQVVEGDFTNLQIDREGSQVTVRKGNQFFQTTVQNWDIFADGIRKGEFLVLIEDAGIAATA